AKDWWIYQLRGVAFSRTNQKEKAQAEFESAIATELAQKNDDVGTEIVQTMAVEMGPDDALARIGDRAKTDNRWRLVAAILYQVKRDIPNATKMIEMALADEQKLDPRRKLAIFRTASVLYMTSGKYEKAIEMNKKILDADPNDLGALNNLA